MPGWPDEPLPEEQLSFRTWVARAEEQKKIGTLPLLHFVLEGRSCPGNFDYPIHDTAEALLTHTRCFVNVTQGVGHVTSETVQMQRDYDSFLAISKTLPYKVNMDIFPVPPKKKRLDQDNHLTYPVKYRQADGSQASHAVSLHCIPHLLLGKVTGTDHTQLYLFFPHLYRHRRPTMLPDELLARFWNDIVRPIGLNQIGGNTATWLTYEQWQIREAEGRFLHTQGILINAAQISDLGNSIIESCQQDPDFKGIFFYHEKRGTKQAHKHLPNDRLDAQLQRDQFLAFINVSELDESYLDIGIEISTPGKCILPLKRGHSKLLQWAMGPDVSIETAEILTTTKKRFCVDYTSTLHEVAGFRCRPSDGQTANPHRIKYVNVYSTDKGLTYQLHKHGLYRKLSAADILPDKIDKTLKVIQDVAMQYRIASTPDSLVNGATRVEMRVALECDAFGDVTDMDFEKWPGLPDDLLPIACNAIKSSHWW